MQHHFLPSNFKSFNDSPLEQQVRTTFILAFHLHLEKILISLGNFSLGHQSSESLDDMKIWLFTLVLFNG